jgi:transposase InsO family protein
MEQIAQEVHKPSMKPKQFRKVLVYFPNDIWSADIVEMNSEGMQEQNQGYKYILVVIDVFTRYAWTRKLKNKTGVETANAFKSIINETNQKPKHL